MCTTACGRMAWLWSKNPARDLHSSSVSLSDESCGSRRCHSNFSFNGFGLSGCFWLYRRPSATCFAWFQCFMESSARKNLKHSGPKISSHSLLLYGLFFRTAVRMRTRLDPAVKTCSRTRVCVLSSKIEAWEPSTCIVRNTTNTRSSAVKPTWDVIAPLGVRLVWPVSGSRKRPISSSRRWSNTCYKHQVYILIR